MRKIILFTLVPIFFIAIFYYDVVFRGRTLLSPGLTVGVMGESGPHGLIIKDKTVLNQYFQFYRDFGSNAWVGEPQAIKVFNSYKNFQLPLWNDNAAMGKPLAANFLSSAFFIPKLVLHFFHPTPSSWDFYLLLRFFLGFFFCFLFLRLHKLSYLATILGSVIFTFSGYFVIFQNIQNVDVDFLVPMLLWIIEASIVWFRNRNGRYGLRRYVILILAAIIFFSSTIPESLFLALLFGFLYLFTRLISIYLQDRTEALTSLKRLLSVFIPAILIVLPIYLISLEFINYAFSFHGPESPKWGLIAFYNIKKIILLAIPYLNSPQFYSPAASPDLYTANYFGLSALVLASIGLFSFRKNYSRLFFFGPAAIIIILKLYGVPHLNDLIGNLPGVERILLIKYLQPELSMSIAVLAAVGYQSLISRNITVKKLLLAIVLISLALGLGLRIYDGPIAPDTPRLTIFLLSAFTLFIILVYTNIRLFNLRHLLVYFILIFVALELFLLVPRPGRPERYDTFTKAPYITFLENQEKPYRTFGLDGMLFPILSTGFNIDDIRELDGLIVNRYYKYIKNFINPTIHDRFNGASMASTEQEVNKITNNSFFDITNAKYLLAKKPPLDFFNVNGLAEKIIGGQKTSPTLKLTTFVINDEAKKVLFQTPPGEICRPLPIDPEHTILRFSLATDPASWGYAEADGVEFKINDPAGKSIFNRAIDPNHIESDRKWHSYSVDLRDYLSLQNQSFCFIVKPRANNSYDWSGWGNLRLTRIGHDEEDSGASQYKLIYNKEIFIYENRNVYPRAFLVGSVAFATSDEEAIASMRQHENNLRNFATITLLKTQTQFRLDPESDTKCSRSGVIRNYLRKNPNELTLEVESPSTCLFVLSETDYPGWVAMVDDKKETIYTTDLMFRGIIISPGKHTVRFVYSPKPFYYGIIGTILGLILIFFQLFKFKKRTLI